jgi:hypothetical protein
MNRSWKWVAAGLAVLLAASPGWGVPVIGHDAIAVAAKSQPLGVRATVRDAAARVESVSLFYAASRGMTPFRVSMSRSGAGMWYGTIPGHMIGPGAQLFYYIQAENADGETKETDWHTVKVVDSTVAPEAIPSASAVAQKAQQQAAASAAATALPAPARPSKARYLLPGAIIVGGAVAVGSALAVAIDNSSGGGGGGGGGGVVTNANFGGNFNLCFTSTDEMTPGTVCDNGLVNVYVRNGVVEIVGLWGAEVMSGTLNGHVFSIVKDMGATAKFPASRLIVAGEIQDTKCTAQVEGFSADAARPGNLNGRLDTTKR